MSVSISAQCVDFDSKWSAHGGEVSTRDATPRPVAWGNVIKNSNRDPGICASLVLLFTAASATTNAVIEEVLG